VKPDIERASIEATHTAFTRQQPLTAGFLVLVLKRGYFATPGLLNWMKSQLFPTLRTMQHKPSVIVLDNCSTYCHPSIIEAIESEGYLIRYLPPYSPDFNPIELSFSVLKAWIRRNWVYTRHLHENFGNYMVWAIAQSVCDRFAREQFKHSANGLYIEEDELLRFREYTVYMSGNVERALILSLLYVYKIEV
jgi:transposase